MTSGQDAFFAMAAGLMSEEEIRQLRGSGMGRRVGFGVSPALLVIDAQTYMIGPATPDDRTEYPVACRTAGAAVPVIQRLLAAFRTAGRPVFYTRQVARPDGRDMGVKLIKRGMLSIEGWYLDGTRGAEIAPAIAPHERDVVLKKTKQSGFHGTPLLDLLVDAGVDTVVVTGGSTSNCVRATAIDAASYNFRTIVVSDGVFDRVRISHVVNLMDIDRQLGDVVGSEDVLKYLAGLPRPAPRLDAPARPA